VATDDELTGVTLAQMIEDHGSAPCGEPMCKVEAAQNFIAEAKLGKDPWAEVLALHVHASLLMQSEADHDAEQRAYRNRYGLFLFEMVRRLGGIVFMPSFEELNAQPGRVQIDATEDGGHVFKIMQRRHKGLN
jgi:hypothetical protein